MLYLTHFYTHISSLEKNIKTVNWKFGGGGPNGVHLYTTQYLLIFI